MTPITLLTAATGVVIRRLVSPLRLNPTIWE